ncbi:MAG TPA: DUF4129 domain-containing protein [Bacillota bacterium]|nr:DUF4129 domain-containing protein [Bacillota bacterium]
MMKDRLRQHIGEFIFCVLVCWGLSVNVFAGYEMKAPWPAAPGITAAVCFGVMAVLFAARSNRYGRGITVAVTAVALLGEAFALYQRGAFSGPGHVDANPALYWVIVGTAAIAVFWASRSKTGVAVLFLAGTFLIAAFDFLKYPVSLPGYLAMAAGMAALFLNRVHSRTAAAGQTAKVDFRAYFVQAAVIALIASLLSGGLYYGVVRPLAPEPNQRDLAERLMSVKILKDLGISATKIIVAEKPKEPEKAKPDSPQQLKDQQKEQNREQKQNSGNGQGLMNSLAITYKMHPGRVWSRLAAVVLLAALAFWFKLFRRKRWYSNLREKTYEEGATELYLYFIKKMKKAGLKRPKGLTLLEYADSFREKLDRFAVYEVNFTQLTRIYLKMAYGYQKISEEEWELFDRFYREFHKNLRFEMGNFKYCLQFFLI